MIVAIHRVFTIFIGLHVDGMQVGPDIAWPDSRESGRMESGRMESEPAPSLPPCRARVGWGGGRWSHYCTCPQRRPSLGCSRRPWSWGGRGPSRAGWPPASPASCIEMCRWTGVCAGGHGAGEGEGPAEQGGRRRLQPHV